MTFLKYAAITSPKDRPNEFPGNNESRIQRFQSWWSEHHTIPLSDYCQGDGTEQDSIRIVSEEMLLGDQKCA